MTDLVLSLFPGIGLLDMAFEQEGFCVVRGPDKLWGGDIKSFHLPAGRFDGVIGGPPCKAFSALTNIVRTRYGENAVSENLIPEFERVITEASPTWFLMENVRNAPTPNVEGYAISSLLLNARSFGITQNRVRRFSFGVRGDEKISLLRHIEFVLFEHPRFERALTASHGGGLYREKGNRMKTRRQIESIKLAAARSVADYCQAQGLPRDFFEQIYRDLKSENIFTVAGAKTIIGNGVPLAMGRAIAKAIQESIREVNL